MAFVQVIRRSMRPEEYTDLRFNWLKRAIYAQKYEITDIRIRDARQVAENEFDYAPGDWRPLRRGELYYTPDGTVFFKAKATIPPELRGKELWLSLWTAAEVLIKVNGRYLGGLDPNRDRTLLSPYIDSDELDIEMEGYNRSKPDDERNPDAMALRGCRQTFKGLYIATIRHEVLACSTTCSCCWTWPKAAISTRITESSSTGNCPGRWTSSTLTRCGRRRTCPPAICGSKGRRKPPSWPR